MSRFTQPMLFDDSTGEWRFRTKADDDYAEALVKECFPETGEPLQELLMRIAKIKDAK